MELARKLAIATAVATAAVVICWHGGRLQYAESQLTAVSQSHHAAAERMAAVEARERIIRLPEDGALYHTSVFVHSDWKSRAQERELLAWFHTNPRLASLRTQTHYHVYTQRMPLFRQRYSRTVKALPCVRVQRADGNVLYQVSAVNVPGSAGELADAVAGCFLRPRPRPGPCPQPEPQPDPDVDVDVDVTPIPDITQPVQPPFPWLLLVVAVLVAAVVPVVVHFKRAFRG